MNPQEIGEATLIVFLSTGFDQLLGSLSVVGRATLLDAAQQHVYPKIARIESARGWPWSAQARPLC
jgi:hypothetical protein